MMVMGVRLGRVVLSVLQDNSVLVALAIVQPLHVLQRLSVVL